MVSESAVEYQITHLIEGINGSINVKSSPEPVDDHAFSCPYKVSQE